jgi:predicted RNase H-like nuclease (RuvC/YqgF family)
MQPFEEDTSFKPLPSLMEKENHRENERICSAPMESIIAKPMSLRSSTPTTVMVPNITQVRSLRNDCDAPTWETNATMEQEGSSASAFGFLESTTPSLQEHHSRKVHLDASCQTLDCYDAIPAAGMIHLERRIELAMQQLADRNVPSKLADTWMTCTKHAPGHMAMAQLLGAAISDVLDLQEALHEGRRASVDASAAEVPVRSSSVPQEDKVPALSSQEATIRQLTMQKQHIITNMKNKKRLLDDTERKLAKAERELQQVSEERNALRLQLESVTESRDSFKNKIRNQQEIVKDTKNGMMELKQRLQKTEQMRALENELLDNFRKLAIHTG